MAKAMTVKEAGRLGAKARHNKPAGELKAIAMRIVKTRLKNDPDSFRKMGKLGASVRHGDPKKAAAAHRKAIATRLARDPLCFAKMGRKGGKAKAKKN